MKLAKAPEGIRVNEGLAVHHMKVTCPVCQARFVTTQAEADRWPWTSLHYVETVGDPVWWTWMGPLRFLRWLLAASWGNRLIEGNTTVCPRLHLLRVSDGKLTPQ